MARIQIINRTTKTEGKITIRFRLRDGRKTDLYHKSEIEADIKYLNKFEADGTPKKRANYNKELASAINSRIVLMQAVYDAALSEGRTLTKDSFEEEINKRLHPEQYERAPENNTLSFRFEKFIVSNKFSPVRTREYWVTLRNLKRFLSIAGQPDLAISQFTPQHISDFQNYLINEYRFAADKRYAAYFSDMKSGHIPTKPSKQNTVQSKLKMVKAFYNYLEEGDEIPISPFRKLGRTRRSEMLREEYNAPIALTLDEVRKIVNAEVPASLQSTKDAFLLQCTLGCRIGDFTSMNMEFVKVDENGIPYVAYVAHKTGMRTNTPLVRFAFDIIKRTSFKFPILKYISGKSGFNKKIKELLEHCGLTRPVEVGKEGAKVLYKPLHEVVSSKTARKTNVTLCADAQVDKAFMGLHEKGSKAISAYDAEGMARKFKIACIAFGEKPYKVDNNLNIITD